LEEAKKINSSYLVMEGDYGGQIYLVCPVKLIRADSDTLKRLLIDIDKHGWNDEHGRGMFFEVFIIGDIVAGGMGGGFAENELWVHEGIQSIKNEISKVIYGKKLKIHVSKS
jgi:hypothetical protein